MIELIEYFEGFHPPEWITVELLYFISDEYTIVGASGDRESY
jgi:hypothetical protein